MNQRSHAATRQIWIDRIARFEQANQTVTQFCAQEGVSPAAFYSWRRKLLANVPAKSSLATFVPVKLSGGLPDRPMPQLQPNTVMSVELPGGVNIRLEVTLANEVQP